MPSHGGDPGVVDWNRRAHLLELEPHCAVDMRHLPVDQGDLNHREVGIEPVGIALVVPRPADAISELTDDAHGDHDLGCRTQHGLDGSISLRPVLKEHRRRGSRRRLPFDRLEFLLDHRSDAACLPGRVGEVPLYARAPKDLHEAHTRLQEPPCGERLPGRLKPSIGSVAAGGWSLARKTPCGSGRHVGLCPIVRRLTVSRVRFEIIDEGNAPIVKAALPAGASIFADSGARRSSISRSPPAPPAGPRASPPARASSAGSRDRARSMCRPAARLPSPAG